MILCGIIQRKSDIIPNNTILFGTIQKITDVITPAAAAARKRLVSRGQSKIVYTKKRKVHAYKRKQSDCCRGVSIARGGGKMQAVLEKK